MNLRARQLASRAAALTAVSLSASAAPTAGYHDLQGIWLNEKPAKTLVPIDGKPVPLTAAGKKLYADSMAKLAAETDQPVAREDLRRCLPFGPTRVLQQPFPLQIIQKDEFFAIVYEHNHAYEIVYLHEKPDLERDPAFMGNAVADWTKDGIAVTNTGIKEQTFLDDSGLPHSEELSVKRVLRRIGDGKQLEVVSTIIDPVMFTRPWSVRDVLQLKPDEQIEEYTCGQGTLETRFTR